MWSRQPLTFEQQVTSLRAPPVAKGPFQSMRENGRSSVEFGWVPQAQAFPPGLLAPGQAPPVLRGVIVFPQAFPTCGYAPEVSVLFPDPANIPAWELRHPRLVAVQGGYTYHGGELAGWKVQDDREHGNLGWVMCRVVADLDSHARVAPRAPQQQQPAPSQQYQRQQQQQQQQPQQQQQQPQQKQQQQPAQPAVEPSLPRPAPQAPTQLPAVPPAFPQLEALDRGVLEALLAETPAGAAAREGFLLANVPALSELLDRERQAAQACQAMAARAQEEAGRVAAAGASLAAAGEAARAAHAAATEARAKLQGATVRPDALLERMRREEGAWKAEGEAARAALATPAGWAAAGSSSGSAGGGGGGGGALAHHSAYLALRTKVHTVRLVREHLARALSGAPS